MALTDDQQRELSRCFDYHAPDGGDRKKFEAITAKTRDLAALLMEVCPPGDELDAALLKLRGVRMWANASIACRLPEAPPAALASTTREWACLCGLATCSAPYNRGSLCPTCEQLVLHRPPTEDEASR